MMKTPFRRGRAALVMPVAMAALGENHPHRPTKIVAVFPASGEPGAKAD
jgi:hypothetical protein